MAVKTILLGTPHGGDIEPEYVICLAALLKHPPEGYRIDYYLHGGLYVHVNRNEICKMAMNKNYDYLLFVDSDMFYLKEDLEELLKLDVPVCGGVYPRRGYPYTPTCWNWAPSGLGHFSRDIDRENPFECDGVATGFLLLRSDALIEVYNHFVNPFAFGNELHGEDREMGEDVWFMKRLNEAGFKPIAHPALKIKHKCSEMVGMIPQTGVVYTELKTESAA